jgi:hypothetical protein
MAEMGVVGDRFRARCSCGVVKSACVMKAVAYMFVGAARA